MKTGHPENLGAPHAASVSTGLLTLLDASLFALLLVMIVVAPWLYGSTEGWAIWTMNWASYICGMLLVFKHFKRLTTPGSARQYRQLAPVSWLVRAAAFLTALILLFTAISAWNARATFLPDEQRFLYYDYITWLPFSYDREQTWFEFWRYLGLACFFWALRDTLLRDPARHRSPKHHSQLPPRISTLLWVVSINVTLLSLVGIFQRLSGTDIILWSRQSWWGTAESFFASFPYRGNAAAYFNLTWPVIVALWWTLREQSRHARGQSVRMGGRPHIMLLPCTVFVAAAPMISSSRGGTVVSILLLLAVVLLLRSGSHLTWQSRALLMIFPPLIVLLGLWLGLENLGPQFRELFTTPYANRNEIYENARQMALDYPVYGIGPGAVASLYQLYRSDPAQPWHAFLHDDWLELQVTFGWVGSLMILCILALALARWFISSHGIPASWEFVALLWLAIGGCLLHAKISFPLQVYSIQQLFLTWCCVLLCLCRPEKSIGLDH